MYSTSVKSRRKLWVSRKILSSANSIPLRSLKLSPRRFEPFTITHSLEKNVIREQHPERIKIHPVIQVEHAMPYRVQPEENSNFKDAQLEK